MMRQRNRDSDTLVRWRNSDSIWLLLLVLSALIGVVGWGGFITVAHKSVRDQEELAASRAAVEKARQKLNEANQFLTENNELLDEARKIVQRDRESRKER
jgi:cell division protein FtsB